MDLKNYRFPDEKLILDFRKEGQHRNYRDTKSKVKEPVKLPKAAYRPRDDRGTHLGEDMPAEAEDYGYDASRVSPADLDWLRRTQPYNVRDKSMSAQGEKMYPEWVDALLGYFR